jgi:hypothetical protein
MLLSAIDQRVTKGIPTATKYAEMRMIEMPKKLRKGGTVWNMMNSRIRAKITCKR